MESWAEVCTLPTTQRPLRVAEFDELFATALRRVDRLAPGWLRLHLMAGDEIEVRTGDLVVRESQCCSFFTFDLTGEHGGLVLDIRVPDEHTPVLDALEQWATAASPGAISCETPLPPAGPARPAAP